MKSVLCFVLGHKDNLSQVFGEFTADIRGYQCSRCGRRRIDTGRCQKPWHLQDAADWLATGERVDWVKHRLNALSWLIAANSQEKSSSRGTVLRIIKGGKDERIEK